MHLDIHHILHYDIKDKKNLFLSSGIRLFGASMITIFVPAILYINTGMSIVHFFLFYVISSLATVVLDLFVTRLLINRYGTKIGMLVALPILVLYYYAIMLIYQDPMWFWLAAVAIGSFTAFFFSSFHLDISQMSKNKKFGSKVAALHIVFTISSALAPLIGGILIDKFGQMPGFILSSIFILASSVPLFMSYKKHKYEEKVDIPVVWKFLKKDFFSPMAISFASKGYSEGMGGIYWPLFLYIMLEDFTKVGLVAMVTIVLVSVLLYISGKQTDKHHESKVMKISTRFQILNWIGANIFLLLGAFSWIAVTLIDILHNFTSKVNNMCITTDFYKKANESGEAIKIVLLHEISIHAFRVVYMSIFALVFAFLPLTKFTMSIPFFVLLIIIPLQSLMFVKSGATE